MKQNKGISMLLVTVMLLCTSCTGKESAIQPLESESSSVESSVPDNNMAINEVETTDNTLKAVEPYDDIRYLEHFNIEIYSKEVYEESEYKQEDIFTYVFNQSTILKGSEDIQAQTMENGKNPGLGIRELHKQGITGKGVNVAIIDENLLLNHPEFTGKITAYYDTGCETDETLGSMHSPAVTSLLVGNSIGVAPDAKVYYVAAPGWNRDSEYYANGLYWIIEENKKLSDDEKIRVVSVSAIPSGKDSVYTNQEMWDEAVLAAQEEGILVLDCREDEETGIIAPAFYNPKNPEDISLCTGGFPTSEYKIPSSKIGVPLSYRTLAEEYKEGSPSYQYWGLGGISFGIPYGAGVLALGWQINPDLDKEQIIQMLLDTCSIANDGSNIINPPAFIEAVKNTKN